MSPALRAVIEAQGWGQPVAEEEAFPAGLMWIWRMWHRLSHDRPWRGGGMGPSFPLSIPWRDVREWCDFHAIPPEWLPEADACIQAMDAEYIAWFTELVKRRGQ